MSDPILELSVFSLDIVCRFSTNELSRFFSAKFCLISLCRTNTGSEYAQGGPLIGKIHTRRALFSVKNLVVLNANNP